MMWLWRGVCLSNKKGFVCLLHVVVESASFGFLDLLLLLVAASCRRRRRRRASSSFYFLLFI